MLRTPCANALALAFFSSLKAMAKSVVIFFRSSPWFALPASARSVSSKLLDQELDAFVAVAAVGKAGVGEEADHALVDLHALRRFRAVGGYRALAALRRDRADAVGDDEPEDDLEREQASPASGVSPSSAI